jgi:hypothetical protein
MEVPEAQTTPLEDERSRDFHAFAPDPSSADAVPSAAEQKTHSISSRWRHRFSINEHHLLAIEAYCSTSNILI